MRNFLSPDEIKQLYNISVRDYLNQFFRFPEDVYTYLLASFGEGAFEKTSD